MALDPSTFKSRRAKILYNLQRQLETINIVNNYSKSLYKVTTDVKNWMDTPVAETPILYLVDETTDYNYHAGQTTERTWNIAIYGVMRDSTQYEMEELIADIEECLFKNVTLTFADTGRTCSHIRIRQIVTDNQLFSQIEGSQLFKINIDIMYVLCVTSIR